jgi:Tol biopolymer transport system component
MVKMEGNVPVISLRILSAVLCVFVVSIGNAFFDVSRDGEKVGYVAFDNGKPRNGFYVSDVKGLHQQRLIQPVGDFCWVFFPRFSPDSSKIAYVYSNFGNVPDRPADAEAGLWIMNADGTAKEKLVSLYGLLPQNLRAQGMGLMALRSSHLQWSPDRKWIVYHDMEQFPQEKPQIKSAKFSIHRVDIPSKRWKRLTTKQEGSCAYPAISPDGNEIVYGEGSLMSMLVERRSAVWLMRNDGSRKRRILETEMEERGLVIGPVAWSLDGKRLVFSTLRITEKDRFGLVRTWEMDPEGKNLHQLMEEWSNPQWSTDGRKIVWQRMGLPSSKVGVLVTDANGGPLAEFKDFYSAKWLPDGDRVVLLGGHVKFSGVNSFSPR